MKLCFVLAGLILLKVTKSLVTRHFLIFEILFSY